MERVHCTVRPTWPQRSVLKIHIRNRCPIGQKGAQNDTWQYTLLEIQFACYVKRYDDVIDTPTSYSLPTRIRLDVLVAGTQHVLSFSGGSGNGKTLTRTLLLHHESIVPEQLIPHVKTTCSL